MQPFSHSTFGTAPSRRLDARDDARWGVSRHPLHHVDCEWCVQGGRVETRARAEAWAEPRAAVSAGAGAEERLPLHRRRAHASELVADEREEEEQAAVEECVHSVALCCGPHSVQRVQSTQIYFVRNGHFKYSNG